MSGHNVFRNTSLSLLSIGRFAKIDLRVLASEFRASETFESYESPRNEPPRKERGKRKKTGKERKRGMAEREGDREKERKSKGWREREIEGERRRGIVG